MVPIGMMTVGETCCIKKIRGNDEVKNRLTGLGFVDDARVSIVGNAGNGNLILSLGDARVALDNKLCSRILVTPVPSEQVVKMRGGHACEKSARRKFWQHS